MTDAQDTQWLDEILEPFHKYSCHYRQAWVKGMTQPFPCDCDVNEAKAAILAHEAEAVAAGRIDEHNLVFAKSGELDEADFAEWSLERLKELGVNTDEIE